MYKGHAEYHEVETNNRWHPELEELSQNVALHASSISRMNGYGLEKLLPSQINDDELKWWTHPRSGIQFAPLPLGWVAARGELNKPVAFAPGLWVCFMHGAKQGDFDGSVSNIG